MKHNITLLYIEQDNETRSVYLELFKQHFDTIITAENGKDGLAKFITHHPDFIITDIRIPDMSGTELIKSIRSNDRNTPILVLSTYVHEPSLTESFKDDINGTFAKDADLNKLSLLIDSILLDKNKAELPLSMPNIQLDDDQTMHHSSVHDLMVVGIGASAGGLEALTALVSGLPKENNTAYVLAQHLSPTHKTMLVDLLSRETTLHVKDAVHGEILDKDIFYITPPNNNIEIDYNNKIVLSAPDKHSFLPKPSVNQLFISLAEQKKDKAVGIILSGTGTDGAQGMRAINSEGGITFVQEPSSAKYDGMPMASINGCIVDIITEAGQIGEELVALANFPRQKVLKRYQMTQPNDEISTIFDLLHRYKKVDFSVYKKTTIGRRIERRMVALKVTTLSDYVKVILDDEKEVELLYKDILIGVTCFFRDKEAYDALKNLLNNYLDENCITDELRIWMPGSSTGEEAYSLAITIKELLLERQQSLGLRIFATDIDDDALKMARKGLYSATSMNEVNETYIKKYFTIKDNQFEVKKSLRENIVFSFHNLLADPPFKNLDLVVCRNLLIYFNLDAQKYIMPTFHYALKNNALLFLGKSENATNFEQFFVPVNKQNKIFKTIPTASKDYNAITVKAPRYTNKILKQKTTEDNSPALHESIILEASKLLMPNIIVTNEQLEVIYKKGNLDYINIPEGYVSYNLYKIIDTRLTIDLRQLVNTAKNEDSVASSGYIPLPTKFKQMRLIKIYLVPIINKRSKLYVFYFNEINDLDMPQLNFDQNQLDISSNQMIELELNRTKEHMQTLVEELETSNEELQSTNEELQSSNEELQSTNEEMETSNEELQSTNEELQIAYAELKEMYQNNTNIKDDLASLNRRYESVLDNISDVVIVSNIEGMFLRTNRAMQEYTGLNKEQLLTRNWSDYFNLKNQDVLEKRHSALTNNGKFGPYSLELLRKNKESIFLEVEDYISKDDEGNTQIWSFASDITTEKFALSELSKSEERYKATFEQSNIGIAHVDLNGKWIVVNHTLSDMFGYTKKEFSRLSFQDITYPDDLDTDLAYVQELIEGKRNTYKMHKRYHKKDGTILWAALSVSVVRDIKNNPLYFISIIEDISLQKYAEEQSAQAQVVFNSTQEAIIVTDKEMVIINANPAFERISGFTQEEIIGKNTRELKSGKQSKDFYDEMLRSLNKTGEWSGEIINMTKSGELYPAYLNISSVKDKRDKTLQYIGVLTDISLLKQSQDKVAHLASHDTLTNLPNRTLFNDRLSQAMIQAGRLKNHLALLFVDLDRFKVINDGLGHHAGDKVLINVSKRFKEVLRTEDTIARVGGDEFIVILEGLKNPLGAGQIAQNIIDELSKEMRIDEHTVRVGASIGISIYPNDGVVADELIRQADIAMYAAKESGRDRYCYTSEELASNALEKATLENAVRNGLNNNEFEVFYQPITDYKALKVVHLEALIRWNHPQLGLVLPGKFIPMAEESDLISEITKYVMFEVIKAIHDLSINKICDVQIAMNFSLKDLRNDSIYHFFKKYLRQFNVSGDAIIIELTERKVIVADNDNQLNIERYRKLGVKFAMDDFGTGYSNLGYLVDKPFNILKVDRSFISRIGKDKKSEEVVKATIAIAKALMLKTVGEGIETKQQFDFLRDNGCDYAQGFYLHIPEPIENINGILLGDKAVVLDH